MKTGFYFIILVQCNINIQLAKLHSSLLLHRLPVMAILEQQHYQQASLFVKLLIGCRGFGGLGVACWPLVPKFAGSNPAEAIGFLKGEKNPQHAFLRRGSKAVGPMS